MRVTFLLAASLAALMVSLCPQPAEACGGFFCNRSAVDQSGEDILFAAEGDGTMTTHVRIRYQGPSEQFAWILPVPSVPELGVGTEALFDQLATATRPRFDLDHRTEGSCRSVPSCPAPEGYWAGGADAGAPAADAGAGSADAATVSVHLRDEVGPYDATVLSSGDADALRIWLEDNGYYLPAEASEALDHYVAKGDFFVAIRLSKDRDAGEIQPLVMRYDEIDPCIPIRLTAIATVPDMPITAYVLGSQRAVPANYFNVIVDLDDPGLWLGGTRYTDLVSQAADDAGGRAFTTDFSGAPPAVVLALPSIEDLRDVVDPATFVRELSFRGFNGDAQLLTLLTRFIPPPEGDDPASFYNCLVNDWCGDGYSEYLAGLPFVPDAFVDELNAAIVDPRREAEALFERHSTLTRLFTTMSAEEMTEDPIFTFSSTAPPVSNVHRATLVTECSPEYFRFDAPQRIDLPSGRSERIRAGSVFDGDDDAYCDTVYPWSGSDTVSTPTTPRPTRTYFDNGCSVGEAATAAPVAAIGFALLLLFVRRRRPRG